jgi:PPP family 3-phenylpropionic acid transporter
LYRAAIMPPAFALRLFWFVYFCGLGVFAPFYGLYLRENAALSGTEVGVVLATIPFVAIFAQPLWGQIADRTGARGRLIVLFCVGAASGQLLLSRAHGFVALVAATAAAALFATPILPSLVSVTFAAVYDGSKHAFGLVRVWGTIGYLMLVVSFPLLLDHWQGWRGLTHESSGPSEPGLNVMFVATASFLVVSALIARWLPRGGLVGVRAAPGEWRLLLRHRPIVRLLLFDFTASFFLHGPMGVFPIYIRAQGGDLQTVGRMWVLMLLLEAPLILLSGVTLSRLGARGLLTMGVLAGGVRWLICGCTDNLAIIYPVQLLHGVVVAGLLIGSPLYIESVVPQQLRSTAQGMLAMAGVGVGGILSNVAAGALLEHAGPRVPYFVGGCGATVLGLLVFRLLPAPSRLTAGKP